MSVALLKMDYQKYGLQATDADAIQAMADSLDVTSTDAILSFGQVIAQQSNQYSHDLFDQIRNTDLDSAGKKLSQVVSLAQSARQSGLAHRSRWPVVGPGVDWVRQKVGRMTLKMESTQKQIETLLMEVGTIQESLSGQNRMMENAFGVVREECRLLGIHLAAGKMRLAELENDIAQMEAVISESPLEAQRLADLKNAASRLDIRLGNLLALQQSALQTLPQIRVVQAGNAILIEKFHTINAVTIPAWKRQIMLRAGLNEQQNAVKVADAIDKATNALLTENAKLLHSNAVQSAAANQRLVIDPKTLQNVQDQLMATVKEVITVHQQGMKDRKRAELEIMNMREVFQKQIGFAEKTESVKSAEVLVE